MLEDILRESLPLDERALGRFRRYYELLTEWNKVMNLTAISGEEDTARLHFLDCAALAGLTELRGKRVIDVGTGAGFPGLVLKILCPETELVLLDSLEKRVRFLKSVCAELGFDDVLCLHARAEEAPPRLRESFDLACSRAVARLNLLAELCLPFVKTGGLFAAMKGPAGPCCCAAKPLFLSSCARRLHSNSFSSSSAVAASSVAPAASSCSRLRKPQLTAMQAMPAFFAVARSTSVSPT